MQDRLRQVRYQKQTPFTVTPMKAKTPIEAKAEIDAFYAKSAERSRLRAEKSRQMAINQLMREVDSKPIPLQVFTLEPKKSLITRTCDYLLNKFLNIEFN